VSIDFADNTSKILYGNCYGNKKNVPKSKLGSNSVCLVCYLSVVIIYILILKIKIDIPILPWLLAFNLHRS
jgi:hypothetical protein